MADCTGERVKEGYSVEETAAVRNRLSGLRLDSSSLKSSSAADPKYPVKTLKRRSPTQSPPLSQPNPKKEKLSHPPHPPSPLLRRCISDTFCFNPTPPPPQSHPEPTNRVREMSLWFQQVMLDEVEDPDDENEEHHHQEQDENRSRSPTDQENTTLTVCQLWGTYWCS
ncbi:unnamed protein product [Malus baccata var. baccata]